jgi:ribosomal protein L37AE/L43A
MSFDEIPENKREEYPCPQCDEGNIFLNEDGTAWECDSCDFYRGVVKCRMNRQAGNFPV